MLNMTWLVIDNATSLVDGDLLGQDRFQRVLRPRGPPSWPYLATGKDLTSPLGMPYTAPREGVGGCKPGSPWHKSHEIDIDCLQGPASNQ